MNASKDNVVNWEYVASFVITFPDDGGEGACDVYVRIGETDGVWFISTCDDAGGSDDADDTAYESRDEAEAAAEAYAAERDEGDGESAEDYLRAADEAAAGEPDPDGDWCMYWETPLDDAGPRERYKTRSQAEAAAKIANATLRAANPGWNLRIFCGFSVRSLVDGVWTESDED